jgi:hypothetical protein
MDAGGILAMLIVLIVAIAAIVYFIRKEAKCPKCPTGPATVSFWTTPDYSSVPTGLSCPAGSVISVQNADYGAPWSDCAWVDVTTQAGALMNGNNAYTIPAHKNGVSLLGIPDPCHGTTKTFAGSYVCTAPAS